MGDEFVEEIIDVCPFITNRSIEYLRYFFASLKDCEEEYLTDNILKSRDFSDCINDIEEWQKNYLEDLSKNVSKSKNYLETISEEIENLKTCRNNIEEDIAKNEEEVELLERKISSINKKKENLSDKRDEVQICKMLTNTSFIYKGSNVSGYVTGSKIDCFEFSPEKLSKKDIVDNLYNTVKKASIK